MSTWSVLKDHLQNKSTSTDKEDQQKTESFFGRSTFVIYGFYPKGPQFFAFLLSARQIGRQPTPLVLLVYTYKTYQNPTKRVKLLIYTDKSPKWAERVGLLEGDVDLSVLPLDKHRSKYNHIWQGMPGGSKHARRLKARYVANSMPAGSQHTRQLTEH